MSAPPVPLSLRDVAEQVAARLAASSLSAYALAARAGVPRSTVSELLALTKPDPPARARLASAIHNPKMQRSLQRIAVALDLPPDTFLPGLSGAGLPRVFGEAVRRARAARGWSYSDVAVRAVVPPDVARVARRAAHLDPHTIRKIEQDPHYGYSRTTLEIVAHALGLPVRVPGPDGQPPAPCWVCRRPVPAGDLWCGRCHVRQTPDVPPTPTPKESVP